MIVPIDLLWKPMLEASAQTIVSAIAGYGVSKALSKFADRNLYSGAMDFWKRGVEDGSLSEGDDIVFDGLLSPYTQLFPGNPMKNGVRWNALYDFEGKISSEEYQAMEFFAGSDAALRIGSLNGETLVGLYSRYGFVGEGVVGVIPTSYLRNAVPDFFSPNFFGARVRVRARVAKCPAQHGFVAQGIANKAGIQIDVGGYRDLLYLQIDKVTTPRKHEEKIVSLLGSVWAVTEQNDDQYLVQYGYISNHNEIDDCMKKIVLSEAWDAARVFCDDIRSPSKELSFKANFLT